MKTEQVKSFFYFSKGERRGILLLVFLIVLTIVSPRIAGMLISKDEELSPELSKEVVAFLNEIGDTTQSEKESDKTRIKFTQPDYLKYSKNSSPVKSLDNDEFTKSKIIPVNPMNLNQIDSSTLLKISGIGPSFAHRILRYRERLGGFVRTDQLREIYGMTSEKYELLKPFFQVDATLVRKVDLNNASFKDLMRHPYSSFELAKAICKFRTKYGKIEQVDDILKAGVIADTSFRKLQPYLAVN